MVLELGWSFACLSWFQFLFSLDVGEERMSRNPTLIGLVLGLWPKGLYTS